MNAPDFRESAIVMPGASSDVKALIASLRTAGADRFDPVRLHYIEVLARRAMAHEGSVRHMLEARLAQAVAELKERFELAQGDARQALAAGVQQYPHAAGDLQRLFDAGDFRALRRLIVALKNAEQCASLSALVRRLEQHVPDLPRHAAARPEGSHGARPELKAVRNFRKTWSKLSVDRQMAQAFEQAPKNAGPINSHMLVLRSLALMRDISPDYLNRFMSYADTLLRLDQGEKEKPATPKKSPAAKTAKK